MTHGNSKSDFEQGIAVGHVTTWLEAFAERSGIPFEVLASRVGTQLLGASGRPSMGADDSVSTLRRNTTKSSSTLEPLAVAGSAHRKPQSLNGNSNGHAANGHSARADRTGEPHRLLRQFANLLQQKSVVCSACGAQPGEDCKSLGMRKSAAGTPMTTSCHTARLATAAKKFGYKPKPNGHHWSAERRREASLRMKRLNFKKHHGGA